MASRRPWIGFIKNVKNTTNENDIFSLDIQYMGIFENGLFSRILRKLQNMKILIINQFKTKIKPFFEYQKYWQKIIFWP